MLGPRTWDQEPRKLSRDKTGELLSCDCLSFCGWLFFSSFFCNLRLANLSYYPFLCVFCVLWFGFLRGEGGLNEWLVVEGYFELILVLCLFLWFGLCTGKYLEIPIFSAVQIYLVQNTLPSFSRVHKAGAAITRLGKLINSVSSLPPCPHSSTPN